MIISNHEVEFLPQYHIYLVDGIRVPSITQMLKVKFGNKYSCVDEKVLKRASEKGTALHKEIEMFEKENINSNSRELKNYITLKRLHEFECLRNEIPVILFKNDEAVACGTTDMLIKENGEIGLADIKRTCMLDRGYLCYQLNLYRLAYQQCYRTQIDILRGIHLREDKRSYIKIPIDEELTWELVNEYYREEKKNEY